MSKTTVLCGSMIPILTKLMEHVNKPVLELGMGWNSTPLLHWLCKEKGLTLLSFETDKEWVKLFRDYQESGHEIVCVEDYDKWEFPSTHFGLVLVDHRPARKRRSSAKYFADKADFVLLHDSELADNPAYKYSPIYDNFKYRYEYKGVGKPYTMILSNTIDIERILA